MDGVDGMGRELVCRSISVLVWRGRVYLCSYRVIIMYAV